MKWEKALKYTKKKKNDRCGYGRCDRICVFYSADASVIKDAQKKK